MWIRILLGVGIFLLGYYIGRQVERDAPTRDWLRKLREEKAQGQKAIEKHSASPAAREP